MALSLNTLAAPLLNLLYPPLCFHCDAPLQEKGALFCSHCLEHLSLMETQERCWTCFDQLYKGRCQRCMHRQRLIHRQLAACEIIGPAQTLLQGMNRGCTRCIAAAASLMAYQWLATDHEKPCHFGSVKTPELSLCQNSKDCRGQALEQKQLVPEIIVALPIPFWVKLTKGNDVSFQLAKQIEKIFSSPLVSVLKAKWDHAHFLTCGEFRCCFEADKKKGSLLCDKRVLLVAPILDDTLFQSAAKELSFFFPGQIGGLAFAIPSSVIT